MLCRLSGWLKSLSPCGRVKGHRPHHDGQDRTPEFKGQHRHPSERHRFHRHRHGFMRFVINVVIPVLIGAAAGVGIGILSVFIAEIVGGIILRIRGRRNVEYIEIEDEELPVYEELEGSQTYTDEKQ